MWTRVIIRFIAIIGLCPALILAVIALCGSASPPLEEVIPSAGGTPLFWRHDMYIEFLGLRVHFQPRTLPAVVTIVGAALVGVGLFWQLRRPAG